jgi:DNA-binding transcriptional ArsR family regulator
VEKNTCIRVFADVNQIKECKKKVAANDRAFSDLARVLELSGNEVRLKILYLLEEEGELCPCDLSDILGMTVPAVSQHLRKLKDGNVIQSKRVGQTIFYSLTEDHLKILKPFFRHINQRETTTVKINS